MAKPAPGTPGKDDTSAAREHYKRGNTLYDLNRFDEAVKEFEAAYELKDDPVLLYNIAQSYRLANKYSEALRFYRNYLRRYASANKKDAPNKSEVEQKIDDMEKLITEQNRVATAAPDTTLAPGQRPGNSPARTTPPPSTTPSPTRSEPPPVVATNTTPSSTPPAGNEDGDEPPPRATTPPPARAEPESRPLREEPAPPGNPGRVKLIAGIVVAVVGLAAVGAGVAFGMQAQGAAKDQEKLAAMGMPFDPDLETKGKAQPDARAGARRGRWRHRRGGHRRGRVGSAAEARTGLVLLVLQAPLYPGPRSQLRRRLAAPELLSLVPGGRPPATCRTSPRPSDLPLPRSPSGELPMLAIVIAFFPRGSPEGMVYVSARARAPHDTEEGMHSDDKVPGLGIPGFSFHDLRSPERLRDLFDAWERGLATADPSLHARYAAWRATGGTSLPAVALSDLLVEVAPHVSEFVARLFGVTSERDAERERTRQELAIFRFKDEFVKRRALKRPAVLAGSPAEHAAVQRGSSVLDRLGVAALQQKDERAVAVAVGGLLDREVALKSRPADDPELIALRDDLGALADWVVACRPALSAGHGAGEEAEAPAGSRSASRTAWTSSTWSRSSAPTPTCPS